MRGAVRNKERWRRRHTPTQYPSTNAAFGVCRRSTGDIDNSWESIVSRALTNDKHRAAASAGARPNRVLVSASFRS